VSCGNRHEFGDNDTQTPALFRVYLAYAIQHLELYPATLQPGEAYCGAELLQVRAPVDVGSQLWSLQRLVNPREVLQSSLYCDQRASRFIALRERSRAR
jgi:hypothetical protein